jgi:hypothetical protein
MRLLRQEQRAPAALLVDDDALYDLMCSSAFRSPSPYLHESTVGQLGTFHGLPVKKNARPGWHVIPNDWQGYGQGAVRG